jgi:membrane protease subunit HflK
LALFFRDGRSYKGRMVRIFRWGGRLRAWISESRNPWGSGGSGGGGGGDDGNGSGSGGDGPRNPWGQPGRPRRPGAGGGVSSLDDFLKKSRARFGGRFPVNDGRPYWLYGLIAFVLLWVVITSVHRIGPQERGVVTLFGRYWGTMNPGIGFSWPSPIGRVEKVDVENIRTTPIPGTGDSDENLILTGDQNVIDLAYSVRWNVSDPALYLFQMAEPDETIREVAESTMRAVVAGMTLEAAIGSGRGEIESRVEQTMQRLLNDYRAGIAIQGVAVNQSVPPNAVNEAFLQVSAAQQQAQSDINQARAYAQQITARAQGEAAAFDKVYGQYRSAPEVTRRRMYYETMERILARVDSTIVEAPGVTPYLALPELQRRQQGQAAQPAPAQPAPAQPQQPPRQQGGR